MFGLSTLVQGTHGKTLNKYENFVGKSYETNSMGA
jgi:hypothetical protein